MPKSQNHNNQQNTKITHSKKCKDSLQWCKETLQWHQSFGLVEWQHYLAKFEDYPFLIDFANIIINHESVSTSHAFRSCEQNHS